MMLDYTFNLNKESEIINRAVENSLLDRYTTPDLNKEDRSYSTDEVGDYIVDFIEKN